MSATTIGSFAQFLTILAIFALVLVLTWLCTRFIANYQKNTGSSYGNVELVEAFRISQTQVMEILRIGDRYLAVAVSKDNVTRLGEWRVDELPLNLPEKSEVRTAGSFRDLMQKMAGKNAQETKNDEQTEPKA